MRIVTFNVNGIRSAIGKGLLSWLEQEQYDVICLQEVKARLEDVDITAFQNLGYHVYWFSAQKKGYSGVAILSKKEAINVKVGQDIEQSDFEGRVIQAEYDNCVVISAYFPSGTSGEERQSYKYVWLDDFNKHVNVLKSQMDKPIFICGDYNIAHQEIDIHSPKTNMKSSGFLPEERQWMTSFLENEWIDTFRYCQPQLQKYSWWSFRANARTNNKGWRIDYIVVQRKYESLLITCDMRNDIFMSDHCPVELTVNL